MSGYIPESRGHCKLPKNALFLQKPFASGQLIDAVRRALETRGTAVKTVALQMLM
jgi:hypothetical protein